MPVKTVLALVVALGLVVIAAVPSLAGAQLGDRPLSGSEMKTMVQNLGYEVKDLNTEPGKEEFEFLINKDGFEIWLAAKVSSSKRFIWITALLGETAKISDFGGRAPKVLEANFRIQPSQFYVDDKGILNMAIATDNRNVTPAVLKWRIDKIVADVASTSDLWKS